VIVGAKRSGRRRLDAALQTNYPIGWASLFGYGSLSLAHITQMVTRSSESSPAPASSIN
jgi:hypothetical protein